MHLLIVVALSSQLAGAEPARPSECVTSPECERMALAAAERKDYEAFHDLAWRAVRTGPKNDPRLMLILARAQSLSGRPHDALVMLRRLVGAGATTGDAETSDDFRRVRSLADWPQVAEAIRAAGAPGIASGSTPPDRAAVVEPLPVPAPPAEPAPPAIEPAAEDPSALRLAVSSAAPIGLAYDAVSRRFVIADEHTAALRVLDERSRRTDQLIGSGWAGLYRTTAIEIDPRQGSLWVATFQESEPDGTSRTAIHKLQLVSGRVLYTVPLPVGSGHARFADVAVASSSGAVFALDAAGSRIFRLGPKARDLQLGARLDLADPTSLAPAGATIVYIAHRTGLARLDLATGTRSNVQPAARIDLQGLRWIRWRQGRLFGIQALPDGSLAAVRLRLDSRGGRVVSRQVIDAAASRAATLTDSGFYYVRAEPGGSGIGISVRRAPPR